MENKNVLIGAVLIILVALLAFNLDITGKATKTAAKVSVSPSIIDAGDLISINIVPGSGGVEKEYSIFCNNLRKATPRYCELISGEDDANTCFSEQTFSYRTSDEWKSGDCYVEFSYNVESFGKLEEKARAYFTIR